MQFSPVLSKIISFILAVITPFLSSTFGSLVKYVKEPDAAYCAMEKAGGIMAGICHPDTQYQKIKDASIGWIREDIPFPFDDDGSLSPAYVKTKQDMQKYVDNGIKVLAITPNPRDYLAHGLDSRDEEDIPEIQQIARFYIEEFRGIAGAFQVANEMGVDRFTKPFTIKEAAKFVGIQLEAMYPIRGDILIGYNAGGPTMATLPFLMMPYNKYVDYVGMDLYFGSFENVVKSMETYPAVLKMMHVVTGKPVMITEFGYICCG